MAHSRGPQPTTSGRPQASTVCYLHLATIPLRFVHEDSLYIAVAGPIGVGKSVLASILADRLGADLVPEHFSGNKYLERFYTSGLQERWAFHTEVAFLNARYDQCRNDIAKRLREGKRVVTDWTHFQNLIYCRQTLTAEDFDTYRDLFDRLLADVPKPDLLILLDARDDILCDRVRGRGREMERNIDPEYVASLAASYREWHDAPPAGTPSLVLDTSELPIPSSDDARDHVLHRIWDTVGFCPLPGGGRLRDLV